MDIKAHCPGRKGEVVSFSYVLDCAQKLSATLLLSRQKLRWTCQGSFGKDLSEVNATKGFAIRENNVMSKL